MWFDLIPPYPNLRLGSNEGYSFFSFGVMYLIGRAIKLFGVPVILRNNSVFFYLLSSLMTAILAFNVNHFRIPFAYNSPFVIIASVCFLISFERISFSSRFINHIAKSTLAILFGHASIIAVYKLQFGWLYNHYFGLTQVLYWIFALTIVFVASVLIDQLRLLFWKPINQWLKRVIINNHIFSNSTVKND